MQYKELCKLYIGEQCGWAYCREETGQVLLENIVELETEMWNLSISLKLNKIF